MLGLLIRMTITSLGLWAAASIVPAIRFDSIETLVVAALLLGITNAAVRPIVIFLTFPITVLTLGLFLLVINAAMLSLVAWLLPGFAVGSFGPAVIGSIIVSLTSWFASAFIGTSGRVERFPDGRVD